MRGISIVSKQDMLNQLAREPQDGVTSWWFKGLPDTFSKRTKGYGDLISKLEASPEWLRFSIEHTWGPKHAHRVTVACSDFDRYQHGIKTQGC